MQAGSAPAPAEAGRWRQVALLGTAAALGGDARVRADLAAALHALDYPDAALQVAREADGDPWARWWLVLAAGQSQPALDVADVLAGLAAGDGPDAREVARRLDDLQDELEDIAEHTGKGRFALLGVTLDAPRRALLVGRSSAVFVVAPTLGQPSSWSGSGRPTAPRAATAPTCRWPRSSCGSGAASAGPSAPCRPTRRSRSMRRALSTGLREDRGARDRRLLQLADEVREERAQLAQDRAKLRTEKSQVAAILRQVAALRAQGVAGATPVPTSRADAAALLEIAPDASAAEIERAFRAQIVRCHPDRVADLHPNIRGQAEGLTVALNAARELLLGGGARPRRRPA